MKTIYLKLLRWLQSKCEHPDYAVKADILEGDGVKSDTSGYSIEWCEVCGSFRFRRMHYPFLGAAGALEWRNPRPDWFTPKERKEYLQALRDSR